ncbi:MAG: hypothetical protein KC613_09565 [Myxococcales bacterium]|nr:hypothetical protein [Myxococcales bacterium]MCB9525378.1 hypothetical protein [Myxococcales bacterium]
MRATALTVCCLLAAGPALAAPTADEQAAAAKYYDAGVTLFKAKDYQGAIVEFTKAYRIDPSPTLVFNMARAFEEMKRFGPAKEFYQRYLELSPKAKDRPQVEATIAALGHLEAQEARPLPAPAGPQDPLAVNNKQPVQAAGGGAPWGWIAVGVGVAALGGFAAFGTLANEQADKLDDLAKDPRRTEAAWNDTQDKGAGYALGADIMLGVGLVAVATGVTLLILDTGDTQVGVGPGGLGVQARF